VPVAPETPDGAPRCRRGLVQTPERLGEAFAFHSLDSGPRLGSLLGRVARASLPVVLVVAAGLGVMGGAGLGTAALRLSSTSECQETSITAPIEADSWVDEDSPSSNKGSDSILSVEGGSLNVDTGLASGRARVLVRFQLPSGVPPACVVESARLHLFSPEESAGARGEAVQLASGWSENVVTWSNQPESVGAPARTWSRQGYMQWNVTSQVQAMYDSSANHGFLIRDADEAAEAGGGGHGFHSKEKGETPAKLVVHFAALPSGEEPGPPAPPTPAAVTCGQELTQSTQVTNDLSDCPGDGLVVGAPGIIVDLDGHTIDGIGLGTGIRNEGHASVTVRSGTVQQFDYGVELLPETRLNLVEGLTLQLNELAGVQVFDAQGNEVRSNVIDANGDGVTLLSGTTGTVVSDNTVTLSRGWGLLVRDSNDNRLEANTVIGGGDLGIGLERASENTLLGNTVTGNSDGGIEIRLGSNGNRVEGNLVSDSGDTGILVDESNRTQLISNTTELMSDSGITLNDANDGLVRHNDLRFNPGGLEMGGSSRNLIESNNASNTTGTGIELLGGSFANDLLLNTANENGARGIYVADEALTDPGNLLYGNTAGDNKADGIVVAKGGHTITANVTRDNAGWGINAALDSIDGGLNVATGNAKPEQCLGVVCKEEWNPPDTTITDRPPASTNRSTATFAFSGADDTTPPSALTFECRLDSQNEAAFVPCSSPRSYTGLTPGLHTFEVRATDRAGNVDPTPATYSWTVDTTPPDTAITSGPPDPNNSTSTTFAFSSSESGSTFECSLDGAAFAACSSPRDYTGLSEGSHTFEVRAIDQAGNADQTPASHTWTVALPVTDTTPPETTIDSRPPAATTYTSAEFAFSSTEAGSTFECSLDGAAFAACSSPRDYTGLSEGSHTFEVRAIDQAGNIDPTPASCSWTIEAPADTTPPETSIDSGPVATTTSTSATFAFSSSEAASTFECRLDSQAPADFGSCSSPKTYSNLALGSHTVEVRAIDQTGNADQSPASYTWTVTRGCGSSRTIGCPPRSRHGPECSCEPSPPPSAQ
jgi:parallel beta-helix repeat protein